MTEAEAHAGDPRSRRNFDRITSNSEVIHLDEKRSSRALEELRQLAATRTERRQPVKLDYFRVADQLDRVTVVVDNGGLTTVVRRMGH